MASNRKSTSGPAYERLQYGDLVALLVEDKGFLAGPSGEDPPPLTTSLNPHIVPRQVRAAKPLGPGTRLPDDFHNRCLWEVLSEAGVKASEEVITYGSMIQLRHVMTGFLLTAESNVVAPRSSASLPPGPYGGGVLPSISGSRANSDATSSSTLSSSSRYYTTLKNPALKKGTDSSPSQFYLRPRYSVRTEGDFIRDQDRVILESCRFKGLQLCLKDDHHHRHNSSQQQGDTPPPQGGGSHKCEKIVTVGEDGYLRTGWQICLVARGRKVSGDPDQSEGGTAIYGGDLVRFAHQEVAGQLIARVDDGVERSSRVSPLGMVYRKLQQPKTNTTAVFVRRSFAQPSILSVWQIIPQAVATAAPIEWDSSIRLRHLVTGQYLAIRPVLADDTTAIRSSVRTMTVVGERSKPGGSSGGGSSSSTKSGRMKVPVPILRGRSSSLLETSRGVSSLGAPGTAVSGADPDLKQMALAVATVSDPLDPVCLFKLHTVRDTETMYVTSKSKCVLVHQETGAHLSLGWSLIAQHGKSATRDRQVHGQGRKRGPSHSDINNIANSNKTDDADSSDSCGSWDYDHDNGVFASCEDNADAEVYRIYPINTVVARNLLHVLSFRSLIGQAVEAVRDLKLSEAVLTGKSYFSGSPVSGPKTPGDVFFRFRSLSPIVSNPDLQNIEGGDERTPEQQPRPYSPSFVQGDRTVRVVKLQASTSSVVDNNLTWLDVCWHLYHALCELIAWQAGEAEADGEIPLRESVAFEDALGGLPANSATRQRFKQCARSTPGYKTKTSSAHYMEKDEVSFDRDNARRRRDLLRESNLAERLLMFVGVVYQFYRGQSYSFSRVKGDSQGSIGSTRSRQPEDACSLYDHRVPLLDACCKLAYRLLREITNAEASNFSVQLLYLGGLNNMVRQISLGWDPPIEEILAAAIDDSRAENVANTSSAIQKINRPRHYRLSTADLYQLVVELYESFMKMDITATKLLKLLASVCAPGNVVDPKIQSFLAGLILSTTPISARPPQLHNQPASLLFSLKMKGGTWEVHLSLNQKRPKYIPDEQEVIRFSEAEKNMIKDAFDRYDRDGNGIIDQNELALLLQDLGMQSLMVEEVQSKWTESCSFDEFCLWWKKHRRLLESGTSCFIFAGDDNDQLYFAGDLDSPLTPVKLKRASTFAENVEFIEEELYGAGEAIFRTWLDLESVLTKPRWTKEAEWFRASLRLLTAFCKKRNLDCQQKVSMLVPVDCLLDIIESQTIGADDKALCCDLLRCCYLEHDLVFPAVALLPKQVSCVSIDPEMLIYGEMGRVFNPLTQAGSGSMAIEPEHQRAKLWFFLESQLKVLEANASKDLNKPDFIISLLHLTRSLLCQGFFEAESRSIKGDLGEALEGDKIDTPGMLAATASRGFSKWLPRCIRRSWWQGVTRMESKQLDYATLAGEITSTLIALEKLATTGLGNLQANGEEPSETEICSDILNDSGPIALKTELLATLRVLQDIRSVKILKKFLWSFARSTPGGTITTAAVEALENQEPLQLKLGRPQDYYLETGFDDATPDGEIFVDAVLGTTIHRDRELLAHAYNLLFHHSIQRIDFLYLVKQVQIAARSPTSITLRLQHSLLEVFDKYSGGLWDESKTTVCDVLCYLLHVLYKLCYRDWEEGEDIVCVTAPLPSATKKQTANDAQVPSTSPTAGGIASGNARLSTCDPFGTLSLPYPSAHDSGIDTANPMPEQQRLLKPAAQRVMELVVKALTPAELCTPVGNLTTTLAPLSPSAQDDKSFLSPASPDVGSSTRAQSAKVAAVHLSPEQSRVVSDAFHFLYHVCRSQPFLIHDVVVPQIKLVRSQAGIYPDAMLLLAEVCHCSPRLAKIRLKDVQAIMERHLVRSDKPGVFRVQAATLFCTILQPASMQQDGDSKYHNKDSAEALHAMQCAIVEGVYNNVLGSAAIMDVLTSINSSNQHRDRLGHAHAILGLLLRCLQFLDFSAAGDSATDPLPVEAATFLGRVFQWLPVQDCLKHSSSISLPLPLRGLFGELLTYSKSPRDPPAPAPAADAADGSADGCSEMTSLLEIYQSHLYDLRDLMTKPGISIKRLDDIAVPTFLLETVPRLLVQYLIKEVGPQAQIDLQNALMRANKAIEKEQKRTRLWRSPELLKHKIWKAVNQNSSLTEWIQAVRIQENGNTAANVTSSKQFTRANSRNLFSLFQESTTLQAILDVVEELADSVFSTQFLFTRWMKMGQEVSSDLLFILIFASLCERHSARDYGYDVGTSFKRVGSALELTTSQISLYHMGQQPSDAPREQDNQSQHRFLVYLSHGLFLRRLSDRIDHEETRLLVTQLPSLVDELDNRILQGYLTNHSCIPCNGFMSRGHMHGADAKGGARRHKHLLAYRGTVSLHLTAALHSGSILKHVLRRHFNNFMVYLHDTSSDKDRTEDVSKSWIGNGGTYLDHIFLMVRYRLIEDQDCCLYFLDLMSGLLQDRIAAIRKEGALRYDAQRLIKLVQAEVNATQLKQSTMQALDGHIVLMAIISQAGQNGDDFMLKILPRVLQFGSRMMATGNREVQHAIVDYHEKAIAEMLMQRKFCAGLRNIMRFCRYQMETLLYNRSMSQGAALNMDSDMSLHEKSEPALLLIERVFSFLSSLCAGHNLRGRAFLREQRSSVDTVNLVAEAASLVYTICSYASSLMTYIKNTTFNNKVAPPIYAGQGKRTRRFIAWHDNPRKFAHLADILRIIKAGFDSLTEMVQGPCYENQVICERLCSFAGDLVEYCGVTHLEVPTKGGRTWFGGDPVRFYDVYLKEMAREGALNADDDETRAIQKAAIIWKRASDRKLFAFQSQSNRGGCSSKEILGVELNAFIHTCLRAEKSCLKFLTAMLEGQSPGLVDHVRQSIDSYILFQNMDSLTFTSSGTFLDTNSKNQDKADRQEAAVLHLTILSTLASLSTGDYGHKMTSVLEEWQEHISKRAGGTDHGNMLVASVEILGRDGQIQQVYFAVPEWIKTYWSYPLVQKAKHELVYQVNRNSPEEKILDFYDRMDILTKVMRRQDLLHRIFRVFHGFVGGKAIDIPFIPGPRALLLILTIILNIWLCARLYFQDVKSSSPIYNLVRQYSESHRVIYVMKVFHLGLCTSLLFTAALNSGAGDATRARSITIMGKAISVDWLVSFSKVIYDVRWLLVMTVFSAVGMFAAEIVYAFCIMDVIPQIRLMAFLLEAISRNAQKISLTILLCLVVLYTFSTVTYMAFKNQYGFNDAHDCTTLVTCFKLHVDYGLSNSPSWQGDGAIAPGAPAIFNKADKQESAAYQLAFIIAASLFNLSYVILVNMVLGAIIAGLIIDTFSQMRSENEAIEADMQEKCFICSIDRDFIESTGSSFSQHVKVEHNMWKYFWFRTYLSTKDPLTFTGPEHYAFEMFNNKRHLTKFFPLKKSLIIERKNIQLKSKNEMDALTSRVGGMEGQLQKLAKFVQTFTEQSLDLTGKLSLDQQSLTANVTEMGQFVKSVFALVQEARDDKERERARDRTPFNATTSTTPAKDAGPMASSTRSNSSNPSGAIRRHHHLSKSRGTHGSDGDLSGSEGHGREPRRKNSKEQGDVSTQAVVKPPSTTSMVSLPWTSLSLGGMSFSSAANTTPSTVKSEAASPVVQSQPQQQQQLPPPLPPPAIKSPTPLSQRLSSTVQESMATGSGATTAMQQDTNTSTSGAPITTDVDLTAEDFSLSLPSSANSSPQAATKGPTTSTTTPSPRVQRSFFNFRRSRSTNGKDSPDSKT